MPPLRPVSRRELVATLKQLGFQGPFAGGRHQVMRGRGRRLIIPNPHEGDIGAALLTRILKQAAIDVREWEDAYR